MQKRILQCVVSSRLLHSVSRKGIPRLVGSIRNIRRPLLAARFLSLPKKPSSRRIEIDPERFKQWIPKNLQAYGDGLDFKETDFADIDMDNIGLLVSTTSTLHKKPHTGEESLTNNSQSVSPESNTGRTIINQFKLPDFTKSISSVTISKNHLKNHVSGLGSNISRNLINRSTATDMEKSSLIYRRELSKDMLNNTQEARIHRNSDQAAIGNENITYQKDTSNSITKSKRDGIANEKRNPSRKNTNTQNISPNRIENSIKKSFSGNATFEMLKLLATEKAAIFYGSSLMLLTSLLAVLFPYSIGKMIDIITNKSGITLISGIPVTFGHLSAILIAAASLGTVFLMLRTYIFRCTSQRVINNIQQAMYRHLLNLDIAVHDRLFIGDIISRLSVDSLIIGRAITTNLARGIQSIAQLSACFLAMYITSPTLLYALGSSILLTGVIAGQFGSIIGRISEQLQDATGKLMKTIEARLKNIRTIKQFSMEKKEDSILARRHQEIYKVARSDAIWSGILAASISAVSTLTFVGLIALCRSLLAAGAITVGDISSFLMYTLYAGSSIISFTGFYTELMQGLGASSRVYGILNEKSSISSNEKISSLINNKKDPHTKQAHKVITPATVKGAVEFRNVRFRYPTRPEIVVHKDFSLKIQPGELVVIRGESGSGKSTLCDLLMRLYDVEDGSILLDGIDIRNFDINDLHRHITVVSQESSLFNDTILNNICYGMEKSNLTKAIECAKMADAHEFIMQLPDNYNTILHPRGNSLSGGQKQRIAIARALCRGAKVFIFDESVSALDAASRQEIINLMVRLSGSHTIISITHEKQLALVGEKSVFLKVQK